MKYSTLLVMTIGLMISLVPSISWAAGDKVTLYKNPSCTCCEIYAQYLRDNGFEVTVVPTDDLTTLFEQHGIPADMQPCHLSMIGDVAIGGHVPIDIVKRYLAEKPSNKAITLPGMPAGGPGMMPGVKTGPFTIYAINNDGSSVVYATE